MFGRSDVPECKREQELDRFAVWRREHHLEHRIAGRKNAGKYSVDSGIVLLMSRQPEREMQTLADQRALMWIHSVRLTTGQCNAHAYVVPGSSAFCFRQFTMMLYSEFLFG